MQNQKCIKCGLVNFASATNCTKCGNLLTKTIISSQRQKSEGKSIIYNGGLSGGVNVAIVFITACIVCTLAIYWAKQYIPDGTYLVGCFLPFAFLGFIVGVILANIANLIYKQISSSN